MTHLGFIEINEIGNFLDEKVETNGLKGCDILIYVDNKDDLRKIDEDLFFRSNPENNIEDFEPSDNEIEVKFKKSRILIDLKPSEKETDNIPDNNNKK